MYLFALRSMCPTIPVSRMKRWSITSKRYSRRSGGYVEQVREGLGPHSLVNYRPLEWQLLADPWFKGRAVLIGDAAHATAPLMASGAGVAVEDEAVLAEELERTDDVEAALTAFMARRMERARLVVEIRSGLARSK